MYFGMKFDIPESENTHQGLNDSRGTDGEFEEELSRDTDIQED